MISSRFKWILSCLALLYLLPAAMWLLWEVQISGVTVVDQTLLAPVKVIIRELLDGVKQGWLYDALVLIIFVTYLILLSLLLDFWLACLVHSNAVRRKAGVALLVLAVVLVGYQLERFYHAVIRGSQMVRWSTCRHVERPLLQNNLSQWQFAYSWEGGMGSGAVRLNLSSSGAAKLSTMRNGETEWKQRSFNIDRQSIARLAEAVDKSALLSATAVARRYVVHDLGTFRLRVNSEGYSKEIEISECSAISDPLAFGEVLEVLSSLKEEIGEEVNRGPSGTSTMASFECPQLRANK